MKRIALFAIAVFSLAAVAASAQTPASDKNKNIATVYLYRLDRESFIYSFVFTRKMPVRFGDASDQKGRTIAGLKKKHYIVLRLPPGSYFFDTKYMSEAVKVDLAAGDERYLRFDHGKYCGTADEKKESWEQPTCEEQSPYIEIMAADKARWEIIKTKPISNSDIKDHSIVIVPPPPK
ncbi:MAG TPA: hypothetical protein VGQ55_00370 [Pyrinomonadaceae bacterium]|jgi:hypothetical protein|nr:hypothetical protein [Pyrinomonadaceae bacterium]